MARVTDYSSFAAMGALRRNDNNAERTQIRVSSGYRVGRAADNPAYWSMATTMRSDGAALSTVQDALGLSQAQIDIASAGIEQTRALVGQIQQRLIMARESGADRSALNSEISQLRGQIETVAQSSSFGGENWLMNTDANGPSARNLVTGFNRTGSDGVEVQAVAFDATATTILDRTNAQGGLLTRATGVNQANGTASYSLITENGAGPQGNEIAVDASTSNEDLDGMIDATSQMMDSLTDAASTLGSLSSQMSGQNSFMRNLEDTIRRGVSRLTETDMNEEATRLRAVQSQQQLGIQALAIANNQSRNILALFR